VDFLDPHDAGDAAIGREAALNALARSTSRVNGLVECVNESESEREQECQSFRVHKGVQRVCLRAIKKKRLLSYPISVQHANVPNCAQSCRPI